MVQLVDLLSQLQHLIESRSKADVPLGCLAALPLLVPQICYAAAGEATAQAEASSKAAALQLEVAALQQLLEGRERRVRELEARERQLLSGALQLVLVGGDMPVVLSSC